MFLLATKKVSIIFSDFLGTRSPVNTQVHMKRGYILSEHRESIYKG